jgi:hypothetical protein
LADTDKSVSADGISVSASVMATLDIGIGQISAKIHGYRPKYIGHLSAKMELSASVADMLVLIYRYWYWEKYWLREYIGIGWTHIGPTLNIRIIRNCLENNKDNITVGIQI